MSSKIADGAAKITVERTFDEGKQREEWSHFIIQNLSPHVLQIITVDLGKCPIISSTVIAGLVHLYDYAEKTYGYKVRLQHCTLHVQNILKMMQLDGFFEFIDLLERN